MAIFLDDLDKKSDDELIAIANGRILDVLSAESTITSQDIVVQAKVILHNRQKKEEKSHKTLTLWVLLFTIAIAILTGILVFLTGHR